MDTLAVACLPHAAEHPAPPGHPENAAKLALVTDLMADLRAQGLVVDFAFADHGLEPIRFVHHQSLIDSISSIAKSGGGYLDSDTYVTPQSLVAARRVCDAALSAVDLAFSSGQTRYFVLGRPPGHHAEPDRAMGFCLINHVAIAAAYAIHSRLARRVAVVDFDVHHGNGTQWTFYDRDDVLFVSTHQYPFYPGSGGRDEAGDRAGAGFTVNFPLPAGTDDGAIISVFSNEIAPLIEKFAPDIILVSAGFDGHRLDPLGGFELTGSAYREIGRLLRSVSDKVCAGRIVSVLEGGYDAVGNRESVKSYIQGLLLQ
ncbi:MAG: histone deacetylase [candidate division Zixibacteria bacterium]|nr:histone deacetylase [candidate division Zixibacteria bacterium]